jgi:hypothetical protein
VICSYRPCLLLAAYIHRLLRLSICNLMNLASTSAIWRGDRASLVQRADLQYLRKTDAGRHRKNATCGLGRRLASRMKLNTLAFAVSPVLAVYSLMASRTHTVMKEKHDIYSRLADSNPSGGAIKEVTETGSCAVKEEKTRHERAVLEPDVDKR